MDACEVSGQRVPKAPDVESGRGTLAEWLHSLVPGNGLGRQGNAVINTILNEPEKASYEGAAALAELAGVNVSTITRTAQNLGFGGWPEFRLELRKRFLAHLGTNGTSQKSDAAEPVIRALAKDRDNLAEAVRAVDPAVVARIARAIAGARRTYVVAESTYSAIARTVAHTARLAGYDVEAIATGTLEIANRLAHAEDGDVVVLVAYWRYFRNAERAAHAARDRGARVFLICDDRSPDSSTWSEATVRVPAAGPTFFPSLVPCLSAGQALVAELAALDPERSAKAIADADEYWRRFGLVHWEN